MKLKYFLRGFGVGIVLTALILSVSYRSNDSSKSIVEQAKELGMVFPEGTKEPTDTIPTEKPKTTETTKTTEAPKATETPKATEAVKETQQPTVSGAGVKVSEATATKKPSTKAKKIKVVLRNDLLSSTVAKELKKAGVVKDDKALDRYFEKSGMARKILGGTFYFPPNASYKEITDIVTGRKK